MKTLSDKKESYNKLYYEGYIDPDGHDYFYWESDLKYSIKKLIDELDKIDRETAKFHDIDVLFSSETLSNFHHMKYIIREIFGEDIIK